MIPTRIALSAFALLPSTHSSPVLTDVSPSVLTAGSAAVPVTLLGRNLAGVAVQLRGCDGPAVTLRATQGPRPVVVVPAALLLRPCVLRVALQPYESGLLLPVADPALLALPVPPPDDQLDVPPWSGRFNMLCESDTTAPPARHALLAVVGDAAERERFVLGRGERALMQVAMMAPAVARGSGERCRYLLLPGVAVADVRWGPDDVEGLWVATLAPDGRTLRDRRFLAEMVGEPSGPLDR
jgi:hypothetical protein